MFHIIKKGLKPEGRVLKVIKRDLENIVGEVIEKDNKLLLKPDDNKLNLTIHLTRETTRNVVEGHKVLVHLTKKLGNKSYLADCIKIIGHKNDAGIDILSIAYKYNIMDSFSPDTLKDL